MAKPLNIDDVIVPDTLGDSISNKWVQWHGNRSQKIEQWKELRNYIYATDTTSTTNSTLPWKNKTTLPKLTQIRDNLYANYMATMFPKRRWLSWTGENEDDQGKKNAITNYIYYAIENRPFKEELEKLVLDYIDYGNCFSTVEWVDERILKNTNSPKFGYVGPIIRRINPMDIVFDPTSPSFKESPKIVRSIVTLGDIKEILLRETNEQQTKEANQALWDYLKGIRATYATHSGTFNNKNDAYRVDGYGSYELYYTSDNVELLTFFGDYYDHETEEYFKNYKIVVADRHKVIYKGPNETTMGNPQIRHVGWRTRQDNLWAMGPLDNLVGMQYRIDHLENLKADVFDLIAFPPLAIKGYVEDFEWGPFTKILMGDDGDVKVLAPDVNALNANVEISNLQQMMEEMAGAPKEAMGFRTPGEKTKYEVQRLENASARIFVSKIAQFEEKLLEPLLNDMLEIAKRVMTSEVTVSILDKEFDILTFEALTPEDIQGRGQIKPMAARHFAEKAEMVQNLTAFFSSPVADDLVKVHFSGIKLANMMNELLELEDYELVTPYIRVSEMAELQHQQQTAQEGVAMASQTPSGLTPDDTDEPTQLPTMGLPGAA